MLDKNKINGLLEEIEKSGRKIDYYLLANLFDYKQLEIIEELKKYQNPDGGFGHGLEPDTMLPDSNIVSTDEAVYILHEITDSVIKDEIVQQVVEYYEKSFIPEKSGWELVPKEVDNYPHAVWWNYSGVDNFSYGNPNPQIIGFLYENSHYLKKIDVIYLINKVIDYIENKFLTESTKHNTLSCLMFYIYMPKDIQNRIKNILQTAVDKELKETNWEEYCLQPYEVLLIAPEFLEKHQELLEKNINYCFDKLNNGLIQPNWQWHQYDEEFKKIKPYWAGRITFNVIKAILLN